MFAKRSLDLVVLSLVSDAERGLSSYAVLKDLKERFPYWNPSAGTIYPLLKKLSEIGDLKEDSSVNPPIYSITEQGKNRMHERLPKFLDESLENMPIFFRTLLRSVPDYLRIHFMTSFPKSVFGCSGCGTPLDDLDILDQTSNKQSSSYYDQLKTIRSSLEQAKKEISEWVTKENTQIDGKIAAIDARIKEYEENKKKWVRITVEEGKEDKK